MAKRKIKEAVKEVVKEVEKPRPVAKKKTEGLFRLVKTVKTVYKAANGMPIYYSTKEAAESAASKTDFKVEEVKK